METSLKVVKKRNGIDLSDRIAFYKWNHHHECLKDDQMFLRLCFYPQRWLMLGISLIC